MSWSPILPWAAVFILELLAAGILGMKKKAVLTTGLGLVAWILIRTAKVKRILNSTE